jgi:hypothetical protein
MKIGLVRDFMFIKIVVGVCVDEASVYSYWIHHPR